MVDQLRRQFIAAAVGSCVFSSVPMLSDSFGQHTKQKKTLVVDEYLYIYKHWMNEVGLEPADYLISRGITTLTNRENVREYVTADFSTANTMNIQGYILSKVEVAIMGSIGKNFS